MNDSNEKRRRKRPARDGAEDSLDALLSSYTPRQREKVMSGLQVLARVAIRSFMEEEAARSRSEGKERKPDGLDAE